ncbi:MAG: glycerol-3-phosphate dehydrogenase/oxidase [Chitinophagaceae bacterium]|nr:glycerol-3-phosphate dehydrogenase/oxidase [Chitinophagaceae bacterium]MBP6590986.1 glycerol-3-phosphate dehydrogenase/oxidase [Chitinophagaceae bacterium]
MNRSASIHKISSTPEFDCCIIGGGATGLGIALDAASRGLKTILLEQHDFAKGTSSRSTKLVHGGVRYLQQGNIRLVMDALKERGLLLRNAPHLVHNQAFIVPNYKWWEKPFYGIGLKIYDKMAGKLGLGPSLFLSKEETLERAPTLDPENLKGSVLYHDGQFDDARLAISIAQTADEQGAILLNYFPVTGLLKQQNKIIGVWARDEFSNQDYEIRSRCVINATGVFSDTIMRMDDPFHQPMISPSQGIHLVVDKEFLPGDSAIMIPRTDDGRVLFAVPWHDKIVLGTTDTAINHISSEPIPLATEIEFILSHIGRYLSRDPSLQDIRSMFAGLRPLIKGKNKKTAALSRDHAITVSDSGMITINGGKWTTYRKMAEETIDLAVQTFNLAAGDCITKTLLLNGHDQPAPVVNIDMLTETQLEELVSHAVQQEMCMTLEDFLSRRTRQLLLDARLAIKMAPSIARMMAVVMQKEEYWINEQINIFKTTASNYIPGSSNQN